MSETRTDHLALFTELTNHYGKWIEIRTPSENEAGYVALLLDPERAASHAIVRICTADLATTLRVFVDAVTAITDEGLGPDPSEYEEEDG